MERLKRKKKSNNWGFYFQNSIAQSSEEICQGNKLHKVADTYSLNPMHILLNPIVIIRKAICFKHKATFCIVL